MTSHTISFPMPSNEADNVDEALFLNVLHNHMAVTQSDY